MITVDDLKRYREQRLGKDNAIGPLLAELRAIRANTEAAAGRITVSPG